MPRVHLIEDLPYCAAGQRLPPAPGSGEALAVLLAGFTLLVIDLGFR